MDLGFANLPPGDGEERIRLLSLRSGWLFAFPNEHVTRIGDGGIRTRGHRGKRDRRSAPPLGPRIRRARPRRRLLRCSVGRYGAAKGLHDLRQAVMPHVTNVMEIGDFHSVGIWIDVELGRYQDAIGRGAEALAAIGGRGPNVEIHTRAWLATALWLTGRWDESLEETAAVTELLGDQRDDPPYFAMHTFGAAAMIHQARGEQAEARRLLDTMAKAASLSSGRTYPSLVRVLGRTRRARTGVGRRAAVELAGALHGRPVRRSAASRRERSMGPRTRPRWRPCASRRRLARRRCWCPQRIGLRVARARRRRRRDGGPRRAGWRDSTRWASRTSERGRSCTWPRRCRAVGRIDDAADALARAAITFEELGAVADLERIRRLG